MSDRVHAHVVNVDNGISVIIEGTLDTLATNVISYLDATAPNLVDDYVSMGGSVLDREDIEDCEFLDGLVDSTPDLDVIVL